MIKKLTYLSGCLAVIVLSIILCFLFGVYHNWSSQSIIILWVTVLITLLFISTGIRSLHVRRAKGKRWVKKNHPTPKEYVIFNQLVHGYRVMKLVKRRHSRFAWYLMIGERCGKSTLLGKSGVQEFCQENDDKEIVPTRVLKWWFFSNLAILDISSNFLNGPTTIQQTWIKLVKWCKGFTAPAGVIISFSISELIKYDPNELSKMARKQRKMLTPLISRFGEHLPLYVIITQCDRFPGFSLWQQQLSRKQREQALGYTWKTQLHIDGQDEYTLRPLFDCLKSGMSQVRLSMACPNHIERNDYDTLLEFPESFIRLEPALRYTLAALCGSNVLSNSIAIQAIWFTASEAQPEKGKRVSSFIQELLNHHLFKLSQRKSPPKWYQRRLGRAISVMAILIFTSWIIVTSVLIRMNMKIDLGSISSEELVSFMSKEESFLNRAPLYLPFLPLLNKQYQSIENQLDKLTIGYTPLQKTLLDFQHRVLLAKPEKQRRDILQLANTILIWKKMREGATLETLSQTQSMSIPIMLREYSEKQSPLEKLAIERHYMRLDVGNIWLRSAQDLLEKLANHDPSFTWLLASSPELPMLSPSEFWPSLSDGPVLSGIWTHSGEKMVDSWMDVIEKAVGHRLPAFNKIRANWVAERQNAWLLYLTDVASSISKNSHKRLSRGELIDISQNNSPSMKFLSSVAYALRDIPESQAQPWLITLWRINQLSLTRNTSRITVQMIKFNNYLRQYFVKLLRPTSDIQIINNIQDIDIFWKHWIDIRNSAVKEAITQEMPTTNLTRGLFSSYQNLTTHNPLVDIYPAIKVLQEKLTPQNNNVGVEIIWNILQNDAHRLLGNAISQSACAINEQWKNNVILPLNKNAKYHEYEQQQTISRQSVSNFLLGPAKSLLVADRDGFTAAQYAGMKVPFTSSFIALTHRVSIPEAMLDFPLRITTYENDKRALYLSQIDELRKKQSLLESKTIKTVVTSLPTTVPNGARVLPIGTRLTLNCQNGEQILNNMNFIEKKEFTWQAGQCESVSLEVRFPDDSVIYKISGNNSWELFVEKFSSGEALIDRDDFNDKSNFLKSLGIRDILVRFTITDNQDLEDTSNNWMDVSSRIKILQDKIISIEDSLSKQSLERQFEVPISDLPVEIAQCK